jgi:hypothetical protein
VQQVSEQRQMCPVMMKCCIWFSMALACLPESSNAFAVSRSTVRLRVLPFSGSFRRKLWFRHLSTTWSCIRSSMAFRLPRSHVSALCRNLVIYCSTISLGNCTVLQNKAWTFRTYSVLCLTELAMINTKGRWVPLIPILNHRHIPHLNDLYFEGQCSYLMKWLNSRQTKHYTENWRLSSTNPSKNKQRQKKHYTEN